MTTATSSPLETLQDHSAPAGARGVGPSVVLACYDRAEGSGNALSYAAGIVERTGAHLVVLSVDESMELDCPADGEACRERVASEVGRISRSSSSRSWHGGTP